MVGIGGEVGCGVGDPGFGGKRSELTKACRLDLLENLARVL